MNEMVPYKTVADVLGSEVYTPDGEPFYHTYSCGEPVYEQIRGNRYLPRVSERPAYTLVSSQSPYLVTPDFDRSPDASLSSEDSVRMSISQIKRLQSFPDWFDFCGSDTVSRRLTGNSVPPFLAQRLAEGIV